MLEWKTQSNGQTALLIEGARRIGKSTVAEEFARNEYQSYILIDFAKASTEIRNLFDDMSDLNYFFLRLQLQYKVDLVIRNSVIIFDEVQLCPKARQAIKALVQDNRYDYIETGSLISIKKNVKDILIPSEERKLSMYPMDYEEFLWALGDEATYPLLKKFFESNMPLGDSLNRKQLRQFRLYMLVGGMPQAVSAYIETNNFKYVDEVKRDILNLYESDFSKIDSTGRLAMLFDAIPAELNKNASRYQISSVIGGGSVEQTLELIAELKDSKTVLVSYNVSDPSAGMSQTKDLSKFKMFICDTGLFVTLMFKDKDYTENVIYEKLLSDKLSINLGYLYENTVACLLAANGNQLFYNTIENKISKHNYEIDFILARQNKIVPLEVKSSGYKTHKSLDVFTQKYSDRIMKRYLVYTKDLRKDEDIICIPVYMTPFL